MDLNAISANNAVPFSRPPAGRQGIEQDQLLEAINSWGINTADRARRHDRGSIRRL